MPAKPADPIRSTSRGEIFTRYDALVALLTALQGSDLSLCRVEDDHGQWFPVDGERERAIETLSGARDLIRRLLIGR